MRALLLTYIVGFMCPFIYNIMVSGGRDQGPQPSSWAIARYVLAAAT